MRGRRIASYGVWIADSGTLIVFVLAVLREACSVRRAASFSLTCYCLKSTLNQHI